MSATELQAALARTGLAADVEARERLAVIRAVDAVAERAIAARRTEVIALAGAHGFTHVALEIASARKSTPALRSHATLPGD